ncbi:MAG: DUF1223 domain-containing protein [Beijerinckiaceae bacterium]
MRVGVSLRATLLRPLMTFIRFATSLCVAVAAALAPAHAAEPVRGVVELFTSQGCSSCPPADRLLGELNKDPSLIVLSWPVDYWDYIGWKDTFAQPAFTARQKAYAAERHSDEVYTPQAVIDGVAHVVGSDRLALETAIRDSARKSIVAALSLRESEGRLGIEVAPKSDGAATSGTLWLIKVLRSPMVPIGRGENRGHSITYTNVVREITPAGEWPGIRGHFDLPRPKLGPGEGLIVLLQSGSAAKPGPVLAAAEAW